MPWPANFEEFMLAQCRPSPALPVAAGSARLLARPIGATARWRPIGGTCDGAETGAVHGESRIQMSL